MDAYLPTYQYSYSGSSTQRVQSAVAKAQTAPNLKSFRHQLGSNLKASGESDEAIAYMMGHQSIESISVYGNRRSGAGHKLHIRPAQDADLSKVRQPKQPAVFGRERVVGRIEVPQRLTNRRTTAHPVANER